MNIETIGQNLRRSREAAGISQRTLAKEAKISRSTIANLELGTAPNVHLGTLKSLCDALGLPITEILAEGAAATDDTRGVA